MTPVSPVTKTARQAQIAGILARTAIRSQEELAELLAGGGCGWPRPPCPAIWTSSARYACAAPTGHWFTRCPASRAAPDHGPAAWPGTWPACSAARMSRRAARTGEASDRDPPGWLARIAAEFLLSAEASANLVVLRTPAGAAQFLASAVDHAAWDSILGTVAGDDTVLVISRDPAGGPEVAGALLRLAERRN